MEVETQIKEVVVAEAEAPVEEKVLIREITLRNILSFGPEAEPIPLRGLNVLIGPNGSGKSNFVEALALLRAISNEDKMGAVIRRGGGGGEWIWKGSDGARAHLEVVTHKRKTKGFFRHRLELEKILGLHVIGEIIAVNGDDSGFFYCHEKDSREIKGVGKVEPKKLSSSNFAFGSSILSQMRDPLNYPELSDLAAAYENIRIYREWSFGRNSVFREPQKADMRNDRLEEDFSNLGLFLNKLRRNPTAKKTILAALSDLYEGFDDFDVIVEGGTVQVFFTEGDFSIPATRLSDGTLRYLCLLAILCDPNPPPLICIEEPELGLHPDILHKLADLLIEASKRTQLIVTTHSDYLVDAMTNRPEAIVICEKHEGQTEMKRLDEKGMAIWLEKYRLGELWTSGELGGTRW